MSIMTNYHLKRPKENRTCNRVRETCAQFRQSLFFVEEDIDLARPKMQQQAFGEKANKC